MIVNALNLISRAYTLAAAAKAVAKSNDTHFFFRLLYRLEHFKPKVGDSSNKVPGPKFLPKTRQAARLEASFVCVFCDEPTTTSKTSLLMHRSEVDHAYPKSRGGTASVTNAQNTCAPCNAEKGNLSSEEYLVEKFGSKGRFLLRGAYKPN